MSHLRKNHIITVCIIVLFFIAGSLTSQALVAKEKKLSKRQKIKRLDQKYKLWLDLVHYIIKPAEKKVFLELTSNMERDEFISLFWKIRDPSKGTPQNEYRDEHIKRFNYANKYYKFDSPRPGWMNDRGRVHIILGPPTSRNEVVKNELRPIDIWEYFGDPAKGLPTLYRVVFYKKAAGSGYELYVPIEDGPESLLTTTVQKVDVTDPAAVFSKINELEPAVGEIALTLIPGEQTLNFSPSMRDPLLISKIYELPKRNIDVTYAKNYHIFKGQVYTRTSEFIKSDHDLYLFKDPIIGAHFVHFAIRPSKISAGYTEASDQYYFNFDVTVSLKSDKKEIFKYKKKYPYYFSKEDLEQRVSHGVTIADYFPVVAGNYQLSVLVQNSINQELSILNRKFTVKKEVSSVPQIYGPIISHSMKVDRKAGYSPFNLMGYQVEMDPRNMYGMRDMLSLACFIEAGKYKSAATVKVLLQSIDSRRPYSKAYNFPLETGKTIQTIYQPFDKLSHGNYLVKVFVVDSKGKRLSEKQRSFIISPLSFMAHPPVISKFLKSDNAFLLYMMMANQYEKKEDVSAAERYFEKAYQMNRQYPSLLKMYGYFLLNQKKYDKLFEVIKGLEINPKEQFAYNSLKGKAMFYRENYQLAIEVLLKANKLYDSDASVLNTLGYAFLKIGNKAEAIRAFEASIKVRKGQSKIIKIYNELKNEK